MSVIAKNPILEGFYPDPSICAVGEDFYICNSSFSYFPGLPILHSKDLAHWEQIGNALTRESQLPLENADHSQGLFAPTIRYHKGKFYIICTNVSHGGNFIVTADKPEGPYSDPYYLQGADGIDPSLFFDDDGRCYYIGTHPNKDGCRYNGDYFIWIQELDLNTMQLIGEKKDVWNGAMRNICWPEGPHIYKKGDYYYIMHAEGGTGPEHAVTVCRSKNIWGPYENNFCNPILTHRHLGKDYPIKYVGHGDLVETVNGEWYMVMLAVRPVEGYTTMGRETFLAKVTWENDWPVVNPGVGLLTDTVEIALDEYDPVKVCDSYSAKSGFATAVPGSNRTYQFDSMKELGHEFLGLRLPIDQVCALDQNGLKMKLSSVLFTEQATPAFVGVRQQHHNFKSVCTFVMKNLEKNANAGMIYCQSNTFFLKVKANKEQIEVVLCENGVEKAVACAPLKNVTDDTVCTMEIDIHGLCADVKVVAQNQTLEAKDIDIRALSTEVAGGFVGCTIGVYAWAGEDDEKDVTFKTFSYEA